MSWLLPLATTVLFSVLENAVKNPKTKASIKDKMLVIRNTINLLYAGDPDFQQ